MRRDTTVTPPSGDTGERQAGGRLPGRPEPTAARTRRPASRADESAGGLLGAPARVLRGVPPAAAACAAIAILSAACWSVITPPFEAQDEPSHFAYVQYLAETGRLPTSSGAKFSEEELAALRDLDVLGVRWHPEVRTIFSPAAQLRLRTNLSEPLSRVGGGGAGVATAEPPLYYALETIPYDLGSGGTLLDRLELMRLLSALMAGVSALFTFLFVREALPVVRWAWIVAGLSAALTPLLGFTSGAVTPDAMLYAVSAATFYCLARAFRRGLTPRLAAATGAAIAVGFLTKLNFIGLAPGAMLGLVILGFRGIRDGSNATVSRRAMGSTGIAMAIALSPVCAYVLYNLSTDHPALGLVSGAIDLVRGRESLGGELAYMWQFYLPRLPGMVNDFPGLSTTRELWYDRTVGLYGWFDTTFPVWVENLALVPAGAIALLGLRSLVARRAALRARLSELLVYATMAVGLMALIAGTSHLAKLSERTGFAQPRYLLPLLPLVAAMLALAACGAGRRWGRAAGTMIVLTFLAQEVFSQLLVVARFYG